MLKTKPNRAVAYFLAVVAIHLCFSISPVQAQGRLSGLRDSVRKNDPPPATPNADHDDDDHEHNHHSDGGRHRDNHRYHRNESGLSWNLFSRHDCPPQVVEHIHIYEPAPVIVATPGAESVFEQPSVHGHGSAFIDESNDFEPVFDSYFSTWNGRLTAFYGTDFDDLSHVQLGVLLQNPGGWGWDTNVTMFREHGMSFRDHLWLGDINLVYEAVNIGDIRARLGVGVNWLADEIDGEAGANLTFGVDWQIHPGWVLTGETDFGSLGDSDLFHGQLSLGRQFGNVEWTTGYNYYDVGGATVDGMFTGLRFRF